MKFKNSQNNYIEKVSSPFSWLWVFLIGPIYWAAQGIWRHAVVHLILALITVGIAHFIYPFFYLFNNQKTLFKTGMERS